MIPNFDWMFDYPPNLPLMAIPDRLDGDFLRKILKTYGQEDSGALENFNIKAISNPGEQSTTAIYRVQAVCRLRGSKFAKNLFIKTTPCEIASLCKPLIEEGFKTEIRVYSEILNRVHQMFRDSLNETHFGPK